MATGDDWSVPNTNNGEGMSMAKWVGIWEEWMNRMLANGYQAKDLPAMAQAHGETFPKSLLATAAAKNTLFPTANMLFEYDLDNKMKRSFPHNNSQGMVGPGEWEPMSAEEIQSANDYYGWRENPKNYDWIAKFGDNPYNAYLAAGNGYKLQGLNGGKGAKPDVTAQGTGTGTGGTALENAQTGLVTDLRSLVMAQGQADLQGSLTQLRKALQGEAWANPIFDYLMQDAGDALGVKFHPGTVPNVTSSWSSSAAGTNNTLPGPGEIGNIPQTLIDWLKSHPGQAPPPVTPGTGGTPTGERGDGQDLNAASAQKPSDFHPMGLVEEGRNPGDVGAFIEGDNGGPATPPGGSGGQMPNPPVVAPGTKLWWDGLKWVTTPPTGANPNIPDFVGGTGGAGFGPDGKPAPNVPGAPGTSSTVSASSLSPGPGSWEYTDRPGLDYRNTRSAASVVPQMEQISGQYNDILQRSSRMLPRGQQERFQGAALQGMASDMSKLWQAKGSEAKNYLSNFAQSMYNQTPFFGGAASSGYGTDVGASTAKDVAQMNIDAQKYAANKQSSASKWGTIGSGIAAGAVASAPWWAPLLFSDVRLKRKIKPIREGLSVIRELEPIEFEYNHRSGMLEGVKASSIRAQDLEEADPEAVVSASTYKAIKPMRIQAHLIKAVQELDARLKKRGK